MQYISLEELPNMVHKHQTYYTWYFQTGKPFDEVNREGLYNALERMNVDQKLISIIKNLYRQTIFMVEIEGEQSEWTTQTTGIRQGCPLSPYLFLVVMTVLFQDIHEQIGAELIEHRIPGATFDEVLYADDTICIATKTHIINKSQNELKHWGKIRTRSQPQQM